MGHIVPPVKDYLSPSFQPRRWYHPGMAEWLSEAEFNEALCARIQRLRVERDWTQQQMATALGVPFERYKKYETRSPLPHYLMPRFAQLVDRDPSYILLGRSEVQSSRGPRRLVRTGTDG